MLVILYTIIVNAIKIILPIARKLQRYKIQIHITRSILVSQLYHQTKLPLIFYNILQPQHCLQLLPHYMQQSLQSQLKFVIANISYYVAVLCLNMNLFGNMKFNLLVYNSCIAHQLLLNN